MKKENSEQLINFCRNQ